MSLSTLPKPKTEHSEKPAGYVEYETRTTLRELVAIYGIEGARQLVSDIFRDEARRGAR